MWQLHTIHGSVDAISLLLKGIRLLIQCLHEHSHITQNVCIDYGTDCLGEEHEEDLEVGNWVDIVASHKESGRIDRYEVLLRYSVSVEIAMLMVMPITICRISAIKGSLPCLIN